MRCIIRPIQEGPLYDAGLQWLVAVEFERREVTPLAWTRTHEDAVKILRVLLDEEIVG